MTTWLRQEGLRGKRHANILAKGQWQGPAGDDLARALFAARDHRLAMLGAVAGLASREGVEVRGAEAADISYPGFFDDLALLTS